MNIRLIASGMVVLAVLGTFGFLRQTASAGAGQVIVLDPATATNDVGTGHTVTATVSGFGSGQQVTFEVISGPNTGASGTCSPDANCLTDSNEEVSFTYTGAGGAGQDMIEACVELLGAIEVQQLPCDTATKDWVQPTPTPTPTPSPTATATPTQAAPAAELPQTGSQPPAGSDFPWFVVAIVTLGALAGAGGMLLRRRAR